MNFDVDSYGFKKVDSKEQLELLLSLEPNVKTVRITCHNNRSILTTPINAKQLISLQKCEVCLHKTSSFNVYCHLYNLDKN